MSRHIVRALADLEIKLPASLHAEDILEKFIKEASEQELKSFSKEYTALRRKVGIPSIKSEGQDIVEGETARWYLGSASIYLCLALIEVYGLRRLQERECEPQEQV